MFQIAFTYAKQWFTMDFYLYTKECFTMHFYANLLNNVLHCITIY